MKKMTLEDIIVRIKITALSVVFGLFVAGAWLIRHHYFGETNFNEVQEISWFIGGMVALYVMFAGVALKQAMSKRSALLGAVRNKNESDFMDNVDVEVSSVLRWLMGNISFIILGGYFTRNIADPWAGSIIAFVIAYTLFLIRAIVLAYDNPLEGVWRMKCVKKEWRDEALNPNRNDCQ